MFFFLNMVFQINNWRHTFSAIVVENIYYEKRKKANITSNNCERHRICFPDKH